MCEENVNQHKVQYTVKNLSNQAKDSSTKYNKREKPIKKKLSYIFNT